jgi:hypothetical protein
MVYHTMCVYLYLQKNTKKVTNIMFFWFQLKTFECEKSCIFIRKLYQQQSNCLTGNCQFCSSSNDCSGKLKGFIFIIKIE